jgi:hypothetical protein
MPDYKCIDEDQVAHGTRLAFPNVQTCIAAIAVLPNELLGYHFTLASVKRLNDARDPASGWKAVNVARATLWVEKAREYVNGQPIQQLYFIGNAPDYDVASLRDIFIADLNGGNAVPTYSYDMYGGAEKKHAGTARAGVTIFAEHLGPGVTPEITYKRESKVVITNKRNADLNVREEFIPAGAKASSVTGGQYHNQDATFQVKNVHGLRRNFTTL